MIIILVILLLGIFYLIDRNTRVKNFYKAVINYEYVYILSKYPEQNEFKMIQHLPNYFSLLFSFKRLRYEKYIPMELIKERILIDYSKNKGIMK